jgi:uncharacterized membrane protein
MLQGLPGLQGAPPQVIARAVSASFSSSPFPDGDELDKYNGVVDGGANRVMALVEGQAAHRQELEQKSVEADIELRKLGLILAFTLSLIAVLGGIALVAAGDEIGALAALLPGIAGLAGVFVWWQKGRRNELPPLGDNSSPS